MLARIRSLVKDEEGATMVEYALMLALIAAVCIAVVAMVGTHAKDTFTDVDDSLKGTTTPPPTE